jgi:hypothetical protein
VIVASSVVSPDIGWLAINGFLDCWAPFVVYCLIPLYKTPLVILVMLVVSHSRSYALLNHDL